MPTSSQRRVKNLTGVMFPPRHPHETDPDVTCPAGDWSGAPYSESSRRSNPGQWLFSPANANCCRWATSAEGGMPSTNCSPGTSAGATNSIRQGAATFNRRRGVAGSSIDHAGAVEAAGIPVIALRSCMIFAGIMRGLPPTMMPGFGSAFGRRDPDNGQMSGAHPAISHGRLYIHNHDTLLLCETKLSSLIRNPG